MATRIKTGLGFATGFYFFYLMRASFYADPYYRPLGHEYGLIADWFTALGDFLLSKSLDYELFSDVLVSVNLVAFLFYIFRSGRAQTIVWQIQIVTFLVLDTVFAYQILWNDTPYRMRIGPAELFDYFLPLGLGAYLFFLLRRIASQIAFDEG